MRKVLAATAAALILAVSGSPAGAEVEARYEADVPRWPGLSEASDIESAVSSESGLVVVAVGTDAPPVTSNAGTGDAVVGGAARDSDSGWFVTSGGSVVAFGGASDFGSMGEVVLNQPIVAMAASPTGEGYWLVGSDGGIFGFGDSQFHGSTGNLELSRPVVDIAVTPSGLGYWVVADDGGVFAFGDAGFFGSMGAVYLNQPIVGMSVTASGEGYWMVARDGGVFAFGDASFHGSTGAEPPSEAVIDVVVPSSGDGYWLVTEVGEVHPFGSAPAIAAPSSASGGSVVGATSHGEGLWLTRHPSDPTMALWQSGGLQDEVAERAVAAVQELGGIASVNHTGTVAVLAVHRRGAWVDGATPGWQIPFTARAIDPAVAAQFVGGDVVGALGRGEIVLSRTTADLRGARPGDDIAFIGWDGVVHWRRVGAVVSDRRVASTEIVFSIADARRFGFDRQSSVWIAGVADVDSLEVAFETIAAEHTFVRWSGSWDPANPDSVLSTIRLKELLGEFEYRLADGVSIEMEPAWVSANIVLQEVPIIGRLRCHRRVLVDLVAALVEVEEAGLASLIDANDSRRIGGCWVPRRIRGSSGGAVSRHAWGLAIDINPSTNRWGTTPTMDSRIVDIFRSHGFAWGGTWTRPDGMHFEWIGGPAGE